MNFPVFDFHCDTALALLGREMKGGHSLRSNPFHIDLERAKTLPGYCQCFACFTTTWDKLPGGTKVTDVFEREMAIVVTQIEEHSDLIRQAFTAEDVRCNLEEGFMSGILTVEGPAGFGFDPALLEMLYQAGIRVSTLGWNEKNPLTGSHVTGGGLTDKGREYVRECQRLGITVDVSHLSDEGFWDIMDITEKPIIASHSNSRAVCNISRNITDDMFKAICQTGGTVGQNLYADFLGENASIDTVCDHIFHFLELDPEGVHISLGGDLDGCDSLPQGFGGISDYPLIARRLLERGAGEKIVRNIYWENALGVLEKCSI